MFQLACTFGPLLLLPPDVIHIMNAPRPSPLPLLVCIFVQCQLNDKKWVGLGTRLSVSHSIDLWSLSYHNQQNTGTHVHISLVFKPSPPTSASTRTSFITVASFPGPLLQLLTTHKLRHRKYQLLICIMLHMLQYLLSAHSITVGGHAFNMSHHRS